MTDKITVEEYLSNQNKYTSFVVPYTKVSLEVPFDKIFKIKSDKISKINIFKLKRKQAYYSTKNQDIYLLFINYFINIFDEDNELLTAYLRIKTMIDRNTEYSEEVFEEDLFDYVLSDTMLEKISEMTSVNYVIKLNSKKTKFHNKKMEFNDEHGKILLDISTAIKLTLPLVTHYISTNQNTIPDTDKYLFKIHKKIFERFKTEDMDLYNKLYEYLVKLLNKTKTKDAHHWERIKITGEDLETKTDDIFSKILVDVLYKFIFDNNIMGLIKTVISKNVRWALKDKTPLNLREISNKRDDEGLSDLDKIEMSMSKFDETRVILSPINIRQTLQQLCNKYDVDIDPEEVKFYMKHLHTTKFQKKLIYQYFADEFVNIDDEYIMEKLQHVKLCIILKNVMESLGFEILQYLLLADVELVQRGHLAKKYIKKITESKMYELLKDKYRYTFDILTKKDNIFLDYIKILLNSDFYLVDYDNVSKLGHKLDNKSKKMKNIIIEETLKFMYMV